MPNNGSEDIITEYIQPHTIIIAAAFNVILLFKLIAFVIANHRSKVIMLKVNTDKCCANTVRNPATWQPGPKKPSKKIYYSKNTIFTKVLLC